MIRSLADAAPRQVPYDVAIILPTLLRPSLDRAVRSVFAQDFPGRIQVLIGIDVVQGEQAQLDALACDCPGNVALDVLDLGYSTSVQHGGLYPNRCTGSLRTVMSYAANSRYLAYLDDDNWWAPDHLTALRAAIEGCRLELVAALVRRTGRRDADLRRCLGIGRSRCRGSMQSVMAASSIRPALMIDKLACHHVLPYWSLTPYADGRGSDRRSSSS